MINKFINYRRQEKNEQQLKTPSLIYNNSSKSSTKGPGSAEICEWA